MRHVLWTLGAKLTDMTSLPAGTGTGYGSQNTGSTAENVKSYVPGTEANRESRYEQGRDTGRNTGSGYNSGNTSGNTGSGHAVRDAAAGIASVTLSLHTGHPVLLLSTICCSLCLSWYGCYIQCYIQCSNSNVHSASALVTR